MGETMDETDRPMIPIRAASSVRFITDPKEIAQIDRQFKKADQERKAEQKIEVKKARRVKFVNWILSLRYGKL